MTKTRKPLQIDSQIGRQQRRLARYCTLIGVLIIGLAMAVMLYYDSRLVDTLSRDLLNKTAFATKLQLYSFFEPVKRDLQVTQNQLQTILTDQKDFDEALVPVLMPFMEFYPQITGFTLSDQEGDHHFTMIQQGEEYLTRLVDSQKGGRDMAQWKRWKAGNVVESWTRHNEYRPTTRPWFKGAMDAQPGKVYMTAPYSFYTTKMPGVTVSSKWRDIRTGALYISSFDIQLSDISRFTVKLQPSEHGRALVVNSTDQIIGLPKDDRYDDERMINSTGLRSVSDLDNPMLNLAFSRWTELGRSPNIFSLSHDGKSWWVGFQPYDFNDETRFWVGVFVPETDFLIGITRERNLIITTILGSGLLLLAIVLWTSIRAIRKNLGKTVSQLERRLGQYKLKYKIGDGGNGAVYRAQHALLRRPTAIKLMHSDYARSETAKLRFEHEVQIMSGLAHPNTVAVYDYGKTPDGALYYAMEYLTGITLENLIQIKGAQPAGRTISILQQVCGSLAEAHKKGMIHRDIKPANVMLCERGGLYDVVKVLDFGLVKELKEENAHLTQLNTLVGTPHYMAPETISSPDRVSPQSDLYAVGAVGYFLLTGHNVFEGSSSVEICASHLHDEPQPPSKRIQKPIPEDLEKVILYCLEKDPKDRPASTSALSEMLEKCSDFGTWTVGNAREWWEANGESLPLDDEQQGGQALSDTQLLVDFDERLSSISNPLEKSGLKP